MGMKFLNKKGWHTGSIRNIETVWKAEQKRDAEELKIEELRKQIKEEREKAEFRQLQVEAGLVPRQERLDFLYDSGFSVGKPSSADGFKELEALPTAVPAATAAAQPQTLNPGALFEEKPQSANDAWRKLNSDPLLQIRKREQEAMARIKNNPIQMAMIKESVSGKKKHDDKERKKKKKKSRHSSSKGSLDSTDDERGERKRKTQHGSTNSESEWSRKRSSHDPSSSKYDEKKSSIETIRAGNDRPPADEDWRRKKDDERGERKRRTQHGSTNSESEWSRKRSSHDPSSSKYDEKKSSIETICAANDRPPADEDWRRKKDDERGERKRTQLGSTNSESEWSKKRSSPSSSKYDEKKSSIETIRAANDRPPADEDWRRKSRPNRLQTAVKLTEEERAARLKEMQMDAEVHEEQRWTRLKKASEADALEEKQSAIRKENTFLDDAQRSVYGTGKGGSSTIEESVRRRKFFMQGQAGAGETNAFRR